MSKAQMPPVPPANRAPMDQDKDGDRAARTAEAGKAAKDHHTGEQGRQGNIKQNTTNQGYQQDR